MIGSAGRLPPAFLESTVTSLGDYDACLSISNHYEENVTAQYCMVDMFPIGEDHEKYNRERDKIYLKSIPLFLGTPLFMSICVPSTCSSEDLRTVFTKGMLTSSQFILIELYSIV